MENSNSQTEGGKKAADKAALKEQKRQRRADRAYVRWFAFLRFVAKVIKIFLPYERHDAVKKYDDRPYVLLCNHFRMIDVAYPCSAMKKPVHFMAKRELWENGFLRWFCNKCRCIPVSRDGSGTDVKAIMQAMKYLKNGENIMIYPEGTRNKDNVDMLPFKGGFAAIAIKTRTPIIPIVQSNAPRLFKKAHVFYGAPIEFPEYYGKKLTEEEIADCEKRIRDIMVKTRTDFLQAEEAKKAAKRAKKSR